MGKILFVLSDRGYFFEALKKEKVIAVHPYYEKGLISRILREIFFFVPFLPKKMWYNKSIREYEPSHILVRDTLITRQYLIWLDKQFPNIPKSFVYANMVGKAKHLFPSQIPKMYKIWTYDGYDSNKYGIQLTSSGSYFKHWLKPLKTPKYDILFVGADKGRGEYLTNLEKRLNSIGLVTKFIITSNGKLSKRKSYYKHRISYFQIVDLIVESRCILNVTMDNQQGITMRDCESSLFGIKEITTNNHIKDSIIYNSNNIFILTDDNISQIPAFIKKECVPLDDDVKDKLLFDSWLNEVCESAQSRELNQ